MNASAKPWRKIALCVTVDWFALSHFKPLIGLLCRICDDVIVVTQDTGRAGEIIALGARVVDLNYHRSSMNPAREAASIAKLQRIFRKEQPDAVHMIAMKPVLLAGLACRLAKVPCTITHMTGLGHIAIADTRKTRLISKIVLKHISAMMRSRCSWLLAENPDDLTFIKSGGARPDGRVTIVGGAGVDEIAFPAQPFPCNAVPLVAYAGRMIRSKGLDVLIGAHDLLRQRGIPLKIELYGRLDHDNPEGVSESEITNWTGREGVTWHGHTDDVREVWQQADISVLPARSREGMPRALLEAAASARPLIVTDVPGCRQFVRHEVEGLIVPPEDTTALAEALARLASDPSLRQRMGRAARQRVIDGFTETHVVKQIAAAYANLANTTC